MPKTSIEVSAALSAHFSKLARLKNQKMSRRARKEAASRASLAHWGKLSKRQRTLEMKRRARVRKKNKIARKNEDELLRERIAKRKAGL